jgi:hypothetical protein
MLPAGCLVFDGGMGGPALRRMECIVDNGLVTRCDGGVVRFVIRVCLNCKDLRCLARFAFGAATLSWRNPALAVRVGFAVLLRLLWLLRVFLRATRLEIFLNSTFLKFGQDILQVALVRLLA